MFFFFFKQKTAYEMRISDWSSDVCSSDLFVNRIAFDHVRQDRGCRRKDGPIQSHSPHVAACLLDLHPNLSGNILHGLLRSEEHTSELQSLMRISYAVFCLKKKNTNYQNTHSRTPHTHNHTHQQP